MKILHIVYSEFGIHYVGFSEHSAQAVANELRRYHACGIEVRAFDPINGEFKCKQCTFYEKEEF